MSENFPCCQQLIEINIFFFFLFETTSRTHHSLTADPRLTNSISTSFTPPEKLKCRGLIFSVWARKIRKKKKRNGGSQPLGPIKFLPKVHKLLYFNKLRNFTSIHFRFRVGKVKNFLIFSAKILMYVSLKSSLIFFFLYI